MLAARTSTGTGLCFTTCKPLVEYVIIIIITLVGKL
jgi:hypothetical protein